MQQNTYIPQNELDEELTINFKKIFCTLWYRKNIISKVFIYTILFFIILSFVLPKKYTVDSDLYINKANNSNLMEINPFAIEELSGGGGGVAALMSGSSGALANELELIQSPLVIDKVIRENDLQYKKLFGLFPTKKTGEYISTEKFLKKNITFENKKGTNILSIEYKNKDPELAYNIVNSIINNYIELHKQLNNQKSKSDKEIIESEYTKAKAALSKKVDEVQGLPENAMTTTGNLTAMSAFSKSAQQAMSTIKGQVIAGERSRIALTEEAAKVAELSSKLEWAKMVDKMSDSSKVLVLKEPQKLRDFEYSSPKLLINIILGIVFGFIISIVALIFAELTDRKLSFSMLSDNIIYNAKKDFTDLKLQLLANQDKNVSIITFENLSDDILSSLKEFKNITVIKADITNEFVQHVNKSEKVILFSKIGQTNSKLYKQIRTILSNLEKDILKEVLL